MKKKIFAVLISSTMLLTAAPYNLVMAELSTTKVDRSTTTQTINDTEKEQPPIEGYLRELRQLIGRVEDSDKRENFISEFTELMNSEESDEFKMDWLKSLWEEVEKSLEDVENEEEAEEIKQTLDKYVEETRIAIHRISDEDAKEMYLKRLNEIIDSDELEEKIELVKELYREIREYVSNNPINIERELREYFEKVEALIEKITDRQKVQLATREFNSIVLLTNDNKTKLEELKNLYNRLVEEVKSGDLQIEEEVEELHPSVRARRDASRKQLSKIAENLSEQYNERVALVNEKIDTAFTVADFQEINRMLKGLRGAISQRNLREVEALKDKVDDLNEEEQEVIKGALETIREERLNTLLSNVQELESRIFQMTNRINALERIVTLQEEEIKQLREREVKDRLFLEGRTIEYDVPPTIREGRTLVPVRAITEGLGAEVNWEESTRTVTVSRDDKIIELVIDSRVVKVNGEEMEIDVPAEIVNNRTIVPIRFISEILEEDVRYNESTGDIDIGLTNIEELEAASVIKEILNNLSLKD